MAAWLYGFKTAARLYHVAVFELLPQKAKDWHVEQGRSTASGAFNNHQHDGVGALRSASEAVKRAVDVEVVVHELEDAWAYAAAKYPAWIGDSSRRWSSPGTTNCSSAAGSTSYLDGRGQTAWTLRSWRRQLVPVVHLAGLLHLLTSGHSVGRLPHRNGAGRGDGRRHHGRAAGLLHLLTSGRAVGTTARQAHRIAQTQAAIAGCWPTGFTTNQITSALVAYRSAADQDTATALSIAAALLSYYTIAQVDGLLAGKLGVTEEGGFQLEGYAMTLSAFAWNIVRTHTLTPGRRYSFGCRYRLGTASNLVMYVSAADNDYVGVTGAFLGTALQGVWSTARLDFSVPLGGIAKLHFGAFGGSIPGLLQQSAGTLDLCSMQIRASAFEGESVSVTDLLADSLALTGSATLDGLTAQGNVGCDQ